MRLRHSEDASHSCSQRARSGTPPGEVKGFLSPSYSHLSFSSLVVVVVVVVVVTVVVIVVVVAAVVVVVVVVVGVVVVVLVLEVDVDADVDVVVAAGSVNETVSDEALTFAQSVLK